MIKSQPQVARPCKTLSRKNGGCTLGIFTRRSAVMFSPSSLPGTRQHFHSVWTLQWSAELQLTPLHFRAISEFICTSVLGFILGRFHGSSVKVKALFLILKIPNLSNTYYKPQWFSHGFEKERLTVKSCLLLFGVILSADPPSKYQVFAE